MLARSGFVAGFPRDEFVEGTGLAAPAENRMISGIYHALTPVGLP